MWSYISAVPPHFTVPPTNATITSGEDVNFTCTATGKPRAVISWLRNNNEVINNNSLSDGGVPVIITNSAIGNCSITDPPSQCVSSSTLQILKTRAVDSGEYSCVANNVAGSDAGAAQLIVNGKHSAYCGVTFLFSNNATSHIPTSLFVLFTKLRTY